MNRKIRTMMREIERRGGQVGASDNLADEVAEVFLREILDCPECREEAEENDRLDRLLGWSLFTIAHRNFDAKDDWHVGLCTHLNKVRQCVSQILQLAHLELHAVAQALWHGKLFHLDLNAQRIGKYDQDFRFGAEGIRDAFYLVRLLEDAGWDGILKTSPQHGAELKKRMAP